MKKIRFFRSILMAAVAAASMIVAVSCSSDQDELLATVPDDVDYVATLNVQKLAVESGCAVDDGRLQLPEYLTAFRREMPDDAAKKIALAAGAFDLEHVVMYGYVSGATFVTAKVKDVSAMEKLLSDMEQTHEAGYTIYSGNDSPTVVVKERQCWMVERMRDFDKLKESVEAAQDGSFLKYTELTDRLNADGVANVVVAPSVVASACGEYWTVLNAGVESDAIAIKSCMLKADGELYAMEGTQPVSTEFLKYVPQNFCFVAAAGLTDKVDWDALAKAAGMAYGFRGQGVVETLLPYLKSVDGTVAVAGGPVDESGWTAAGASAWQGFAMAHMKPEMVSRAINQISAVMRQYQIPVRVDDKGVLTTTICDVVVRLGDLDGYLAASINMPLGREAEGRFAESIKGHHGAMVFESPAINKFVNDDKLNFGFRFEVESEPQSTKATLRLVGSDMNIVAALLTVLNSVEEHEQARKADYDAPYYDADMLIEY